MKRYFIRCIAGGSVIGSRDLNDLDQPLTKQEAHVIAKAENERSERRRLQKLPYCFDFAVQEVAS